MCFDRDVRYTLSCLSQCNPDGSLRKAYAPVLKIRLQRNGACCGFVLFLLIAKLPSLVSRKPMHCLPSKYLYRLESSSSRWFQIVRSYVKHRMCEL